MSAPVWPRFRGYFSPVDTASGNRYVLTFKGYGRGGAFVYVRRYGPYPDNRAVAR